MKNQETLASIEEAKNQSGIDNEEENEKTILSEKDFINKVFSSKNKSTVSNDDPVRMYLKEIGSIPLLKGNEEVELAKEITAGRPIQEAVSQAIKDSFPKIPDAVANSIAKNYGTSNLKDNILDDPDLITEETSEEEFEEIAKVKDLSIDQLDEIIKKAESVASKVLEMALPTFKEVSRKAQKSKRELTKANLRLVVSIAKKYVGRGMLFLDLIQEGNLGLIRAVEKFDYTKGYKFSTYATWWIRQAITRAIADQARTIRIPVHMVETINRLKKATRQLSQTHGRKPTEEEIAEAMDVTITKLREIIKVAQEPISLETPIGKEEDSRLSDFIEDNETDTPVMSVTQELLRDDINEVLATLTKREQDVLRLRFGLDDGHPRTLEEVGQAFQVTRERIRQIEAKALRKLRHPNRNRRLREYIE